MSSQPLEEVPVDIITDSDTDTDFDIQIYFDDTDSETDDPDIQIDFDSDSSESDLEIIAETTGSAPNGASSLTTEAESTLDLDNEWTGWPQDAEWPEDFALPEFDKYMPEDLDLPRDSENSESPQDPKLPWDLDLPPIRDPRRDPEFRGLDFLDLESVDLRKFILKKRLYELGAANRNFESSKVPVVQFSISMKILS